MTVRELAGELIRTEKRLRELEHPYYGDMDVRDRGLVSAYLDMAASALWGAACPAAREAGIDAVALRKELRE